MDRPREKTFLKFTVAILKLVVHVVHFWLITSFEQNRSCNITYLPCLVYSRSNLFPSPSLLVMFRERNENCLSLECPKKIIMLWFCDKISFENGLLSFQSLCFKISNRSVTSTEVKLFRQASIFNFFQIVKWVFLTGSLYYIFIKKLSCQMYCYYSVH